MAEIKTYIVDFRTLPNGAYKYMQGMRRGYWRLLEIDAGTEGTDLRSNGVRVLYQSPEGIDGVTDRSKYYIGDYESQYEDMARELNQFSVMGVL